MVARRATRSRALGREKQSEALPLRICKLNSFAPAVLLHLTHALEPGEVPTGCRFSMKLSLKAAEQVEGEH